MVKLAKSLLGNEFKVGIFAIISVVTLGYMFFVLSPDAFESRNNVTYYTVLANAAGIVSKTHVKTAGVSIGKVKGVVLQDGQTKVTIEIDGSLKIPEGSKIEIRSVGLLGDKHLEVIRPQDNGQYIAPGGFIPQSSDTVDMEAMIALVGSIAKDVKKVTGTLANVFGSQRGELQVQNILDNVEAMTADLRASSKAIRSVVGDRGDDLNDIVTNVRDTMRDFRAAAATLKAVASPDNKDRINRILASFDDAMVDVKSSVKHINLIAQKVEKGEGTIGKLVNDDSTIQEIEGAIKDIRKVLAPATKLEIEVDYHGEVRKDRTSQHYVNVLFRTRPDRYYLVGLTDTTYDIEDKTTEPAPTDPGKTRTKETIRTQKALRFNLQVAKRWYNLTLRGGLFETTGGFASDIHLFDDRVKVTAEAFDWDLKSKLIRRNAHLKAYASVLFYNHVYAMVGVDDVTKIDPDTGKARKLAESTFFGGGISFNDQDLKAIFGAAALAR